MGTLSRAGIPFLQGCLSAHHWQNSFPAKLFPYTMGEVLHKSVKWLLDCKDKLGSSAFSVLLHDY